MQAAKFISLALTAAEAAALASSKFTKVKTDDDVIKKFFDLDLDA